MIFTISLVCFLTILFIRYILPKAIEARLDVIITGLIISIAGILVAIIDLVFNGEWILLLTLWFLGQSVLAFHGGYIIETAKLKKENN